MQGFTYNGIHSSEFGLYYTRDANEKWFNDPEYDVYDDDVEWRHGGYYYGSKAKNRVFTINCFFEEIDTATKQRIKQWVRRDSSGELFFDDMPFVYWNVRPGKIPVGQWLLDTNESHSGTVTITFNAYEPFGYLTRKSNRGEYDNDGAKDYCSLISSDHMPDAPEITDTHFDIYNPGTEECGLSIEISGTTENPIRFINERNGTTCEFTELPSNDIHIRIDGETGFVSAFAEGSTTYDNGYAYHDKGTVRVEPCIGYEDVPFVYSGLNGTTYCFDLTGTDVNSYMINGEMTIAGVDDTYYIVAINRNNNRLYCTRVGSNTPPETGICDIKTLNHIAIQEKSGNNWSVPSTLSLTSINVDYSPRVL